MIKQSRTAVALVAMAGWVVAGCGRDEVKVQRVAKVEPAAAVPAMPPGHEGMRMGSAMPQVKWQAPEGWQEQGASGMSVARFKVPGVGGLDADVAVLAIPGMGGMDLDTLNLNIFRERLLQLEPLDAEALKALAKPVATGSGEGVLYDMASEAATNGPVRMLVTVLTHGGASYYVRMTGAPATVEQQMSGYQEFLKSVTFAEPPAAAVSEVAANEAPASSGAAVGGGSGSGVQPAWEVPAGWTQGAPSPMVLARFLVGGSGSKTEVTVSSFPGDVGGLAANINRWRGQVGLASLGEAEARQLAVPVDVAGTKAMLVDVLGQRAGDPVRLMGLIVPQGDTTWFYKMVGEDAVVTAEKDRLIQFARSGR